MRRPSGKNHCGGETCGPRDPFAEEGCACDCSTCERWQAWLVDQEENRREAPPTRPVGQQAVIYTRFSPRRDAETAISCDTQEAQCRALLKSRGWGERSAHRDEAVSGAAELTDRGGLMAAIAGLERGDVLAVYHRDRLARDVFLAESVRRLVAGRGARIEAVQGDAVDGEDDSPEARLVRTILDAMAQFNREAGAARTSAAMQQQQRDGKRVSRHPPFGKRLDPEDPSRLVDNPDELEAIERVCALAAEGLAYYAITQRMTREGWTCRGHKWSYFTVRKILTGKT